MNTISLFSGAGGMDLGAQRAGARIVLANEKNPDAAETHRHWFPETRLEESDIADLDIFPSADLVIGGYPCQSFSRGGTRKPATDRRTDLFRQFGRVLRRVQPRYFVVENVEGLRSLQAGHFLEMQRTEFEAAGYRVSIALLDAKDFGVPQTRQRVFIVGVHEDLGYEYRFPERTHGPGRIPYASHGDAIADLPLWPIGEFYAPDDDPDVLWPWYYMSRNRKRRWEDPSYTIVAHWRHVTLHPASPAMKLTWSNWRDGTKQRWDFSGEYDHLEVDPTRPKLPEPRRFSWREAARLQGFPVDFEPVGSLKSKYRQIGNAVPPALAQAVVGHLISGRGLIVASSSRSVKHSR